MAPLGQRALSLLARAAMAIAVLQFAALTLIQLREAAGRFLNSPSTGATEWTGILMAGSILVALPIVLATEQPIEMTLLYDRLGSRARRFMDGVRWLATIGFFAVMASAAWPWALDAAAVGERRMGLLDVPIWPAKVLFAVSLGSALVVVIVDSIVTRRAPDDGGLE